MKYTDYLERKRHGSVDFPIEYYCVNSKHSQYIMPAHWHNEFEIIRVVKGSLSLFLNNIEYKLHSGDIIFIECGCLHRATPQDSLYECIVFDLNILNRQKNDAAQKYISPIINSSVGVNCMLNHSHSGIYTVASSLFSEIAKKAEFYELRVCGILFELFAQLYSQGYIIPSAKTLHSQQSKTVSQLIDWIEKNYTDHITLQKLSEISGFSPKYLCRIFKEYTSKTPINYINGLRIENSCYEMTVKGKSITQAAFDSGFNDLSYFCKAFKKHLNMTPNQYKKSLS